MVSGRGTAAAAILTAAGGRNVVTSFVGYRPLSPEIAAQADPDVVVTTEQTLQSIGGPTALLALPGLGGAGGRPRVVAVDALLLLGFGPRIAHAIKGLMGELHGAERLPNLPMRAWVENR
jgi:iron complex transport system substrate-binding protein